ncbi:MAG TPA: hypothetical protein DCL08_08915 [Anaerolineaceae bacterium]|jgi:hypothetical protein|nr:hypothetical protein [Anaerolineaceae bacterium]
MNYSQSIPKDFQEGSAYSESSTSEEALWSQIEVIIESDTEAKVYNSFCEQCIVTKASRSNTPDKIEINQAEKAVDHLLSFSIDEISENSENFDFNVYRIIKCYDALSIMVFEDYIDTGKLNHLIAVALLSFLGRFNDPNTYNQRIFLLKKCLKNKSRFVRDGARLGLLYLQNPNVIPYLKEAIEQETSELLREKLIYTISVLEG